MTSQVQTKNVSLGHSACCKIYCCGISVFGFRCSKQTLRDIVLLTSIVSMSVFSLYFFGGDPPTCFPSAMTFSFLELGMGCSVALFLFVNCIFNVFVKSESNDNSDIGRCLKICNMCCWSKPGLCCYMILFAVSYCAMLLFLGTQCLGTFNYSNISILGLSWGLVCVFAMILLILKQTCRSSKSRKKEEINLEESKKMSTDNTEDPNDDKDKVIEVTVNNQGPSKEDRIKEIQEQLEKLQEEVRLIAS